MILRSRRPFPAAPLLAALLAACATTAPAARPAPETAAMSLPLAYPAAPRGDAVDAIHGTKVADPYRWLEEEKSPATRAWVDAEDQLARRFLAALPARDAIAKRLE